MSCETCLKPTHSLAVCQALAEAELDQERANMLLDGIYSAVVVRDILERGKRKEQRAVTDALLLRKIILFLADNIGNNTSAASIGRTLVNEGLLDNGRKEQTGGADDLRIYQCSLGILHLL